MPIKGLTEQLRLPRLGKIRLGEKRLSKKGVEYPVALDYFVVPEEVKAIYGDKPRQLDIMFPADDENIIFPQHYKRYGKQKGLICKGDGEEATRMTDEGRMEEIACPGKDCKYFQKGECKAIGNLQVWLWKVPGLGVYQIDTSSINSILNINGGIRTIKGIFGRIRWIPLVLKVEMQEAHPLVEQNGRTQRIATTIPVMSITAQVSVEQLIRHVREKTAKGELPITPAEIVNPQIDEKPELLFLEGRKEAEEPKKEEEEKPKEEGFELNYVAAERQKEEEARLISDPQEEEIQKLFEKLNYPPVRQRMTRERFKNKAQLIEHLRKELESGRQEELQLF